MPHNLCQLLSTPACDHIACSCMPVPRRSLCSPPFSASAVLNNMRENVSSVTPSTLHFPSPGSPLHPLLPPPHARASDLTILAAGYNFSGPSIRSACEETPRTSKTTPHSGDRRRRHPRQAADDRSKRFRKNSLQPFHDRRQNGSRRQKSHALLEIRCHRDGLPWPSDQQPSASRAAQSRRRLGGFRFPQSIRASDKNYQRRQYASPRQL